MNRKHILMASAIALYQPARVRFLDDGDKNLKATMELLPRLFPEVDFEFVDVVHARTGHFEHRVIASSGASPGTLVDAQGDLFTDEEIRAYRSEEAAWVPDPELYHGVPVGSLPFGP